jgi:hypothetical protein
MLVLLQAPKGIASRHGQELPEKIKPAKPARRNQLDGINGSPAKRQSPVCSEEATRKL